MYWLYSGNFKIEIIKKGGINALLPFLIQIYRIQHFLLVKVFSIKSIPIIY